MSGTIYLITGEKITFTGKSEDLFRTGYVSRKFVYVGKIAIPISNIRYIEHDKWAAGMTPCTKLLSVEHGVID